MNNATTNAVAATIQRQIGSRAFAMLGAFNLIAHPDALGFRIKGSRAANHVKVALSADDTYTVTFCKVGTARTTFAATKVAEFASVYVDGLHALIESHTGLYTSM